MAEEFIKICEIFISKNDRVSVAFSGGSTPKLLFQILGSRYKNSINWSKVFIFWVDERCVPPESDESNFGMTFKYLLSRIKIPEGNVFQIEGEKKPNEEAKRYSGILRNKLKLVNNLPKFDIMLLGIGDDGHTASIFSDQMYLLDSDNFCEVAMNPASGQKRITLTGKVINNSDRIYFLVSGKNKSQIIKKILCKEYDYLKYPASHILQKNSMPNWFLDKEAARLLDRI